MLVDFISYGYSADLALPIAIVDPMLANNSAVSLHLPS